MIQKILNFLIYSVVLLLPLHLIRFGLFGIPTNLVEILIGLTFVLWIFQIKKTSPILSLPKIYWLAFLLIFLGITISTLLNPNLTREAGIIKGWFIAPFLFFLLILDRIQSEALESSRLLNPRHLMSILDIKCLGFTLLKLLYVSSASVGLISLFYLLTGNLTFDGRLQAFYLSPNHLAMFLTPGIIFGIFEICRHLMSFGRYGRETSNVQSDAKICVGHPMSLWTSDVCKRTVSFYFLFVSSLIMLVALYFTFSYGAWLAIFLSVLIALLLSNLINRSQKIYAFLFAIGLLAIVFSYQLSHQKLADIIKLDERSSLASRIMIWNSAWKIGQDNLVWGIGPGNFQEKYLAYQKYFPLYLEWAVPQPHNLYLAFWLQGGLLGLIGFLVLVSIWTIQIIKNIKSKKNGPLRPDLIEASFLATALLAMMLSILIHGLIDTPYWKNDLAILFWIIIALGTTCIFDDISQKKLRR